MQSFNTAMLFAMQQAATSFWVLIALLGGLILLSLGGWLFWQSRQKSSHDGLTMSLSQKFAEANEGLSAYQNPSVETIAKPDDTQLAALYDLFETQYLAGLISQHEHISLWSVNRQEQVTLQREEFFVRPYFRLPSGAAEKLRLSDLLANFRHLVLLGPPGCGKTETLIYLMLSQARYQFKKRLGLSEEPIPILLSAPELAITLGTLSNFSLLDILQQHLRRAPLDYVKSRLEQGRFTILIDSLNEIYISDAEKIIGWFETQIAEYPLNRLLVVARPAVQHSLAISTLTIAHYTPLTADRFDRFTQRWQPIIPNAADIVAKILSDDDTYALAQTPANLLMLLIVAQTTEVLPTRRVALYPLYLETLLNFEAETAPQFSEYQKRTLLQNLAFIIHQHHQVFMNRANISKSLRGILQISEEIGELFIELCLESGLLTQSGDRCRFGYLNLQEFLVAREVIENNLHQLLNKQMQDMWWGEVISFYDELTNTNEVVDRLFTQETEAMINQLSPPSPALNLLEQGAVALDRKADPPAASAEATSPPVTEPEPEAEAESEAAETPKPIILVVDDTPQNLKFARFILERAKYTVAEAADGVIALEWLQTNTPTLILSDIQMPNMNGFEFCERLQADERLKAIPFIFVTAYSRASKEVVKGLKLGASDYIPRPFAPEELLARIDANVRVRQAEEAMRMQADKLARRNRELGLLNQLQRNVTASLDLDQVLNITLQQTQQVTKAEATSLWFIDRENQHLVLTASFSPNTAGDDDALVQRQTHLSLQEGVQATVAATKQPYLTMDMTAEKHHQPQITSRNDNIKSLVCVPLQIKEQVIGLLQAVHREAGQFKPEDLNFLTTVADSVTVAIENAWLFGRLQRLNQEQEQMVKARTRELFTEKEKTDTILVSIADGLLVTDSDRRIVRSNPAMEKLLGVSLSQMTGLSLDHPNFVSPMWDFIRNIHEQKDETYTEAIDLAHPSNPDKILSFQASAAKMVDETNQTYLGRVIALRDVTALQEVDRMKVNFMTGSTHELKTPLAIITLQLGGLLKYYDRLDDERKVGMLHKIENATELLKSLVDGILELSKLDSGMLTFKFAPVDLGDLVQQVVTELQPLAEKKSLGFSFHAAATQGIMVEADGHHLSRVIRNLVENGIKYTPEGRVDVRLSTNDGQAIFQVTDTGIGLTEEQIERLFERFYRADNQRNIPGTGLGLSIAEEIVKKHKGKITVTSQIGKGSTFNVVLPLLK